MDNRICYLRIRGKFNNVTIISVPAHMEEKDELVRTAFTISLIGYIKEFQDMILKLSRRFLCKNRKRRFEDSYREIRPAWVI